MKIDFGTEDNKLINKEDKKPHESVAAIFTRYTEDKSDLEYLVMLHKKYEQLTFPIGKVKPDQAVTEALIAENKEELAVEIENFMEILQFQREYEVEGKTIPDKVHIFKVVKFNGEPKNVEPDKCGGIYWLTRKAIEEKQKKLGDCIKRYFAWLDDINAPSLVKPNVTVGQGK